MYDRNEVTTTPSWQSPDNGEVKCPLITGIVILRFYCPRDESFDSDVNTGSFYLELIKNRRRYEMVQDGDCNNTFDLAL